MLLFFFWFLFLFKLLLLKARCEGVDAVVLFLVFSFIQVVVVEGTL